MDLKCDDIGFKCKMREVLLRLREERKSGRLGSLGGVQFQTLGSFFRNLKMKKLNTGIYNVPKCQVVAIGDVHGDLLALLSALFLAGVIDSQARWIGGKTIVVQLGDLMDRGGRGGLSVDTSGNSREELDIFQYIHGLNKQAENRGGAVVSLVGNHEAQRFTHGDQTDPKDPQLAGWGGLQNKQFLFQPKSQLALYFAYCKPLLVKINDVLFCHGGVLPSINKSIQQINQDWRKFLTGKLRELPENVQSVYLSRHFSETDAKDQQENANCIRAMQKLKTKQGVDMMVVAHTVQTDGIPLFCDGKVWRIDVGLSEAFGRRVKPIEVLQLIFRKKKPTIVQIVRGMQDRNNVRKEIKTFENGQLIWEKATQISL